MSQVLFQDERDVYARKRAKTCAKYQIVMSLMGNDDMASNAWRER